MSVSVSPQRYMWNPYAIHSAKILLGGGGGGSIKTSPSSGSMSGNDSFAAPSAHHSRRVSSVAEAQQCHSTVESSRSFVGQLPAHMLPLLEFTHTFREFADGCAQMKAQLLASRPRDHRVALPLAISPPPAHCVPATLIHMEAVRIGAAVPVPFPTHAVYAQHIALQPHELCGAAVSAAAAVDVVISGLSQEAGEELIRSVVFIIAGAKPISVRFGSKRPSSLTREAYLTFASFAEAHAVLCMLDRRVLLDETHFLFAAQPYQVVMLDVYGDILKKNDHLRFQARPSAPLVAAIQHRSAPGAPSRHNFFSHHPLCSQCCGAAPAASPAFYDYVRGIAARQEHDEVAPVPIPTHANCARTAPPTASCRRNLANKFRAVWSDPTQRATIPRACIEHREHVPGAVQHFVWEESFQEIVCELRTVRHEANRRYGYRN